ncbi:MAG: hypothetical protein ABI847_00570 [Anaerolineales bacterium]
MNLDFGGILKRAWDITWRNKILWIFGILSAIGTGTPRAGNNINFNRGPNGLPDLGNRFPNLDQNTVTAIVIGVGCLILILALVFWLLSIVGRGGLIGGINLAETRGTKVSFGEAWAIGTKNFITVLIIGLAVAILGLVVALGSTVAVATICLAPLGCIGFLLIPVLGVFTYLAQIAAVTDHLSVGDAFGRAWQIVKANIGAIIVLGLILVIVNAIIGLVVALPLGIALAPVMVSLVGAANNNTAVATGSMAIAALCVVAWIPVLIIVRGIVETWVTSAWVLAYRRLSGQSPAPLAPMAPMAPPPMAS